MLIHWIRYRRNRRLVEARYPRRSNTSLLCLVCLTHRIAVDRRRASPGHKMPVESAVNTVNFLSGL